MSLTVAMCRSGLCTSTPAGGAMSAAVTLPGPCLRRYITVGLVVLGAHDELLDVQDEVGDVFLHTGHGGELVQYAVDADAGDRGARDGREQCAAQRVTEGVTEAGLERLDDEPGTGRVDRFLGQGGALCDEHGQILSVRDDRYMTPRG